MPTLYAARQVIKMRANTGLLSEDGSRYRATTWVAKMTSTMASERFFGWRGSSSCETMSCVVGTVKTLHLAQRQTPNVSMMAGRAGCTKHTGQPTYLCRQACDQRSCEVSGRNHCQQCRRCQNPCWRCCGPRRAGPEEQELRVSGAARLQQQTCSWRVTISQHRAGQDGAGW